MSRSLTFEEIYLLSDVQIKKILNKAGINLESFLKDRFNATIELAKSKILNENDCDYTKLPQFEDMYINNHYDSDDADFYDIDDDTDTLYEGKFDNLRRILAIKLPRPLDPYLDLFNVSFIVGNNDEEFDEDILFFLNNLDPENYEGCKVDKNSEKYKKLDSPLPIGNIKLYYDTGCEENNILSVEYPPNMSVLGILKAINSYYNQPISEKYTKEFPQMVKHHDSGIAEETLTRRHMLGDHVYFQGLLKYDDGYIISFGS